MSTMSESMERTYGEDTRVSSLAPRGTGRLSGAFQRDGSAFAELRHSLITASVPALRINPGDVKIEIDEVLVVLRQAVSMKKYEKL